MPDAPGHFLLNPFGLPYTAVCASNPVKVDVHGNTVAELPWPINSAAVSFHGAIHQALPDAHCVMHVHTTAMMAVFCPDEGLSFNNFYAAQLYGKVADHDFEGITVPVERGQRILASAAGKPELLLRSHGPVAIGFSLGNAFSLMWLLNRACEVQVASQALGKLRPIPVPVL